MKNKTKVLLSSMLTIAMTASLAVGGTYALFTSEDEVNIAVTSGKVEVTATIDTVTLYSMNVATGTMTFANGGTAMVEDDQITLTNVTPGDKAVVTLDFANNSNVAIQYRMGVMVSGELAKYLTLSDENGAPLTLGYTDWETLTAGTAPTVEDLTVAVELPENVGNDAQNKTNATTISVFVEAVQGNAEVKNADAYVKNAEELETAIKAGGEVKLVSDIELGGSLNLSNADFVLDGNGYTVTMTEGASNPYALFDITGGTVTMKNINFDGIKEGAVVRTVHAEFNADNINVENCEITQINGLFRLLGKSTVTNCTFKNNTCNMVISLNWDGANEDPQKIQNCVFENNTCNSTAVVYYVKGAGATIDGNKFIENTVNATNNAATLYMGFTENNVITNNVFKGNHVTTSHETSNRVTGGLMIGYAATITGNAFIDNVVTAEGRQLGNDVCVSPYYTDIDLSGNYWGGSAPVAGDDYYQEYDNYSVIINDYLTEYDV